MLCVPDVRNIDLTVIWPFSSDQHMCIFYNENSNYGRLFEVSLITFHTETEFF